MRNPQGIHRQAEQEAKRGGNYYDVFLHQVIEESKGKSTEDRQAFTQDLRDFVNTQTKDKPEVFYQAMLTATMKQFKDDNAELFLRGSNWESIVKSSLVDHFVGLDLDQNARKQFFREALSKVDIESKVGIDNQPMENLSQHLKNNYQKFESVLFPSLNVGFNQLNAALARVQAPSSTSTSTTVPEKKGFFSRFGAKQEDPVKEQSQALEKGFGNVEIQFNILNGLLTTTTFEKYNATKSAIEKQKAKLKEVQDEFLSSLPTEELKAKFTQVVKSQSQVVQVSELKFDEKLTPIQRQNSMNLLKPNLAQLKVDTQELKNDLTEKALKKGLEQQAKEDKRASTVSSTSTADPQTLSLRSSSSRKSSDADLPALDSSTSSSSQTPVSSVGNSPRNISSSEERSVTPPPLPTSAPPPLSKKTDGHTSKPDSRRGSVELPPIVHETLPPTETEAEKLSRVAHTVMHSKVGVPYSEEVEAYLKDNGPAVVIKVAELRKQQRVEPDLVREARELQAKQRKPELIPLKEAQEKMKGQPTSEVELIAQQKELEEGLQKQAILARVKGQGVNMDLVGANQLKAKHMSPQEIESERRAAEKFKDEQARKENLDRARMVNRAVIEQEQGGVSTLDKPVAPPLPTSRPPVIPSSSSSPLAEGIAAAKLKSASQQADSSVAKPVVAPSIAQAALLQKDLLKKAVLTPKTVSSVSAPVVVKTPAQIMAEERAKRTNAASSSETPAPSGRPPLPPKRQMPVKQGSHTDAALNRSSDGIEVK
jgi:hypothetical protein